jgi:hypothetical protein
MSGTVKSCTYEELAKIWKAKNYDQNFLIKPNLPYSKNCIIIDRKTGKVVRIFEKNYNLSKHYLMGTFRKTLEDSRVVRRRNYSISRNVFSVSYRYGY